MLRNEPYAYFVVPRMTPRLGIPMRLVSRLSKQEVAKRGEMLLEASRT